MATDEAGDATRAAGGEERREDREESLLESAVAEAQDGASSGVNGREEAAQSTGNAGKRRRRKRNNSRKRRRRGREEEEETKGGEAVEEEKEEEYDEEEGSSSAFGSAEQDQDTGGEQDQVQDMGGEQDQDQEHDEGGEQEQQNDSVEEEEDEPFPIPEPISSSDPATAAEQVPEQMLVKANLRVETGGRRAKVAILPDEDELLLRAVAAHEAQLTDDSTPKRPVWASIAAACGDRFASGASATGKVLWLTRVFRDHRHDQHDSLTEPMKAMLKQYLAFMGEDDSPRAMPKRKAKLALTDPAIKRRARFREKQRLQELAQQREGKASEEDGELVGDAVEETETVEEEDATERVEQQEEMEEEEPEEEEEQEQETTPRRNLSSDGRVKLDAALEEELLEAAVKYIPALAATDKKAKVWDDIAKDSNGRYKSGASARIHFVWLLNVLNDPSEREHANLTPKLRKMLEEFEKVCFSMRRRDKRKGRESKEVKQPPAAGKNSKKSSKPREGAVTGGVGEGVSLNEGKEFPPLPISKDKVTIDAELEEKLLVPIMKHIPAFEAAELKGKVWDAVAEDSRGRYKSGISARLHYVYLLRVMKNPNEREHSKLTPKLQEMLTELDRVGFKPKKTPSSAKENETTTSAKNTPKRPRKMTVQPASEANKPNNNRLAKRNPMEVNPEMDEALMEMQLKFRPFDYDPFRGRTEMWKQLLQALNHPRLATSNAASSRSYWLRTVLTNPDHVQHNNFTPRLRKLVTEYVEALESSPTEKKTLKQPSSTSVSGEEQQSEESDGTSAVSEPIRRSQRRARDDSVETPTNKRMRTEDTPLQDDTESATVAEILSAEDEAELVAAREGFATPVPTTFEDHVLLVEILRDPPFLAKRRGGRNPRWEIVSRAVQTQIGTTAVLTTGEACMRRMVKLLSAVRTPGGRLTATVPNEQLEMLSLINTLNGFKMVWPSFERNGTELYLSLKERIAAMLAKPLPSPEATQMIPSSDVNTSLPDDEVDEVIEEEEAAEADEDEEDHTLGLVEVDPSPPVRDSRRQTRQRTEDPPSLLDLPVDSVLTFERPTVEELLEQREPVPLGNNGSFAAQLKSLQENVATCRAEITVQSSRLEKGRRHHRQELLAMFELLKQEHDTHTAEAAELLGQVEKERLERRDEFANMIDLVSQMLPPL